MLLIIAAVLIIGGLVAAAVFAIGVPVVLGLMALDITSWTDAERVPVSAAEATPGTPRWRAVIEGRIKLERQVARGFVIVGGAFWGVATFAGLYSYRHTGMASSLLGGFIPLMATLVTLVVGWYYERITAFLLTAATAFVVYWGVTNSFEAGVWALVTIAFIGPMMTAAVLFFLARREQKAMEFVLASRPELAPATIRADYR